MAGLLSDRCYFFQVFEDLHDYMKSLDKILALKPTLVYPAHGALVKDPITHLTYYISHRNEREAQIIKALESHKNEFLTAMDIVKIVYVVSAKIFLWHLVHCNTTISMIMFGVQWTLS